MTDIATMTEGNMQGPFYPWLWEVKYEFKQRIVQSNMGGENETVGHRQHVTAYHVVAPSEAAARFAWWSSYGTSENAKIISVTCLLKVDDILRIEHLRY